MTNHKKDQHKHSEAPSNIDPRGDDDLNTPESSDNPIVPPSQHTPHNPSDGIEDQIEASDARTKQPGAEFEKLNDEQLRDYAIKQGIDGNDGLNRDQIIEKIRAFKGKRMFEKPEGEK